MTHAARLPTLADRAAGVLLHPTSLPGGYVCGDLGDSAYRFADMLAAARQRWWQMLPVHPVGQGDSPYTGLSAFAGAPHLIALDPLVREGWLEPRDVRARGGSGAKADIPAALRHREAALRLAFARFLEQAPRADRRRWERFQAEEAAWLEDYALYMALKDAHGGRAWMQWPAPLRTRAAAALRKARGEHAPELAFRAFEQWQFARQWASLRSYCAARGVALLGDVPIFVAHDSAEVWAHPELFHMNRHGRLSIVAGVPPDAFSDDGQRWGNPLYDWPRHRKTDYAWWSARLQATLRRFDAVRLDHFIGFVRYWAIPAGERTARKGRFHPGPGAHFLGRIREHLGHLPLIAEDLGLVTPAVTALREQFALPGMRVLQFAFGEGGADNPHLPYNHERNSVVYTGTHDNDTALGWARESGKRGARPRLKPDARRALAYLGLPDTPSDVHWSLMRLAHSSIAALAIVPVQDILGVGNEGRMNRPGVAHGNWSWRLTPAQFARLANREAERLSALTVQYGRAG